MTDLFALPWMPPAQIVRVEGRGEFFVRRHVHPDPDRSDRRPAARMDRIGRPAVLHRLPGARRARVVHRDRPSGPRSRAPNARRRSSSTTSPTTTSRSPASSVSNGPCSSGTRWAVRSRSTIAHRHRAFVTGIVVQATALEWLASRRERWRWRLPAGLRVGVAVAVVPDVRAQRSATPRLHGTRPRAVPRLARSGGPSRRHARRSPRRGGR